MSEDDKLFKQEHIRPEDLLTDGPNNFAQQIQTEETTVARTKQQPLPEPIPMRRYLRIVNHEAVYDLYLPYIAAGGFLLLSVNSLISLLIVLLF